MPDSDYIELHARSAFSFLRGASSPEALIDRAAALDLPAVALCDRDGVPGAPRFFAAAREKGVRALVGSELTMADGSALPVLVASRAGYQNLCRLVTRSKLRSPKNEASIAWEELPEFAEGLVALTGDEEGALRRHLATGRRAAAEKHLDRLRRIFGERNVFVEIQRHRRREERPLNALLLDLADAQRLPLLATNGVLHDDPARREVLDVFTCARLHTHLDAAGDALAPNAERHFKGAAEMRALFADRPDAIANTRALAERLEFTLENLGYEFPRFPVPEGESMDSYLRAVTLNGARERYGDTLKPEVRRQLEHELAIIKQLGFAGYFLIVWDLINFCRDHGHPRAGPRQRGQQRGLLLPRHHRGRSHRLPPALRALSQRRPQELAGHRSRSAERRSARARDPGSLPALRPPRRGHDGERHHLSAGAAPCARSARRSTCRPT